MILLLEKTHEIIHTSMNKRGPIIMIEDDHEDQEIFREALKDLKTENALIFFDNGVDALEYLIATDVKPFLIISDLNLPKLNGIALRDKIYNNEQLSMKCIPYLFFTTSANHHDIVQAYSKSVQGFFTKPNSYTELVRVFNNILEYWKDCKSPNV